MGVLIRVLRIYGWYVAIVLGLGLLLAGVVWLRASVARWWKSRSRAALGTPRNQSVDPGVVTGVRD
jgi:hypothetical protein